MSERGGSRCEDGRCGFVRAGESGFVGEDGVSIGPSGGVLEDAVCGESQVPQLWSDDFTRRVMAL